MFWSIPLSEDRGLVVSRSGASCPGRIVQGTSCPDTGATCNLLLAKNLEFILSMKMKRVPVVHISRRVPVALKD